MRGREGIELPFIRGAAAFYFSVLLPTGPVLRYNGKKGPEGAARGMDDRSGGGAGNDLAELEGLLLQVFADGRPLLTGEVSRGGDGELVFERMAGQREFGRCEAGAAVTVRGFMPCVLEGAAAESTGDRCRITGVRAARAGSRRRADFRLAVEAPVLLRRDGPPEEAVLVDLSAGGACVRTGTAYQKGDTLCLEFKLEDTPPVICRSRVVRVEEASPGDYRCGVQFYGLSGADISALATAVYRLKTRKK